MCVTELYSKSGTGHRVPAGHSGSAREDDLCKEYLVVYLSSCGYASLLCKPFWYSMCNEAELFSQLYSFDYIGSLVSAKARRGDKIKAHLLSHICLCDSLGADNQVV